MPSIGPKTRLLSFDIEANGLHGNAFAVGAVVLTADGKVHDEFSGRCDIEEKVDPWVADNVIPVISDMPVNFGSYKELREGFWQWYLKTEPEADYVLVSNGYPVEYRFLLQCQEDNLNERYWQHPFPILDLTSLLLAAGHDPASKNKVTSQIVKENQFYRHNPLHDAKIAALTALQVLISK